ncbi:hypothetical protein ARMSODRAFT_1027790 [Armillaria solidipes]|uniref:Protein kinase domain-containing protein n=1 Tax=Armillaria solidipes TaxID=1076256 RepID=A0A2H3AJB0_9AGAR|nr:hypothetical protein ARMSODRAFT_1027790 [Armillaria solidipes]
MHLLGPPPVELINRIHPEYRPMYFDEDASSSRRNEGTFEAVFFTIPDSPQKGLFIAFLKRMLRWLPEERTSIDELLADLCRSSVQAPRNR